MFEATDMEAYFSTLDIEAIIAKEMSPAPNCVNNLPKYRNEAPR